MYQRTSFVFVVLFASNLFCADEQKGGGSLSRQCRIKLDPVIFMEKRAHDNSGNKGANIYSDTLNWCSHPGWFGVYEETKDGLKPLVFCKRCGVLVLNPESFLSMFKLRQ